MRLCFFTASAALIVTAQPTLAQDSYDAAPMPGRAQVQYRFDPADREAWLRDCRQRVSARDSGIGGAVIGGVAGGFAGNRIAGAGNRTVGTIAGAAVGAAVGAAIDKAEDAGRYRDECEAYLDDYYARYTQATYYAVAARPQPECTETVEYVYEDVPTRPAPRKRYIPRPTKTVPDKRVPIK